ncbi:hypothetical protein AK812_SmicGene24255 [Symbiodinium microadriaticum]|uniref:Uncharacterized protein n=1 Tax=Symbiodinium microadriaticum TaxID=2951 RepID=A0A1Q9DF51_SYMMI|nr:hypothetical protein AK812_SmicGene24255 [Symbiodinium microadriaticum]
MSILLVELPGLLFLRQSFGGGRHCAEERGWLVEEFASETETEETRSDAETDFANDSEEVHRQQSRMSLVQMIENYTQLPGTTIAEAREAADHIAEQMIEKFGLCTKKANANFLEAVLVFLKVQVSHTTREQLLNALAQQSRLRLQSDSAQKLLPQDPDRKDSIQGIFLDLGTEREDGGPRCRHRFPDFDIYLTESLIPVLVQAMDALCRQVAYMEKQDKKLDARDVQKLAEDVSGCGRCLHRVADLAMFCIHLVLCLAQIAVAELPTRRGSCDCETLAAAGYDIQYFAREGQHVGIGAFPRAAIPDCYLLALFAAKLLLPSSTRKSTVREGVYLSIIMPTA